MRSEAALRTAKTLEGNLKSKGIKIMNNTFNQFLKKQNLVEVTLDNLVQYYRFWLLEQNINQNWKDSIKDVIEAIPNFNWFIISDRYDYKYLFKSVESELG